MKKRGRREKGRDKKRLMKKLPESEGYETDGYVVYEDIDRRRYKVKKYKRENRNEGKGYSKSVRSLEIYLALIFIYWRFINHLLH